MKSLFERTGAGDPAGLWISEEDVLHGVNGKVLDSNLVMEMGAGGSTRVSDFRDEVSPFDLLADLDVSLMEMAVLGGDAVAVVNDKDLAVSILPPYPDDEPVGWGNDGRPNGIRDVNPLVHLNRPGKG